MRVFSPALPPDLELLCRLARVPAEGGSLPEGLSPEALERAVEAAHAHNVLGVILPALRRWTLPGPLEARLAAAEVGLAAQALFRESELETALGVLAAAGVEAAVLKGAFLASCVYGDFAARPMNDVDLFVPEEDLRRAGAALCRAGYRPAEGGPPGEESGMALHVESPAGQAIEVRADLTQGTRLRGVVAFAEAELWRRRRAFATRSEGRLVSLDPTDHLLYLAYHAGILHLFTALVWLVDLDRHVRAFRGQLAWGELAPRARRIGCATCLWHGLALTRQLLGTPIDDAVLRMLAPARRPAGLVGRHLAPRNLLRGMVPPPPLRMLFVQMLLLDTAGAVLRSFWQGLFPPRRWLTWRYRTSNPIALLLLRAAHPMGAWARRRG